MSAELPDGAKVFMRVGEIVMDACSVVTSVDPALLKGKDVKGYLGRQVEAVDVFLEAFPSEQAFRERKGVLQDILADWEIDRRSGFLYLLEDLMQAARDPRGKGRVGAVTVCIQTLLREPLFSSKDPEGYKTGYNALVQSSLDAVGLAKEGGAGPDVILLLRAQAAGVMYNADLFCPEVYKEQVLDTDIKESKEFFDELLLRLQQS